jgi:hypothetical protein
MRNRLLYGEAGHCEPEARCEDGLPVNLCNLLLFVMALEAGVQAFSFEKYPSRLSLSPHSVIKTKPLSIYSNSIASLLLSLQKYPSLTISTTYTTMESSLISLPRELRNRIYHHLWTIMPVLLFPSRTAWYACPPMPVDLVSGVSHGLPHWLLASRTILAEGIDEFHMAGTIEVNLSAGVEGKGLLAANTARHIHVTPRLSLIHAVPAAVWREIHSEDGRRLGEVMGIATHATKCTVVIQLDHEAQVAEVLDFSALNVVAQTQVSRVELWLSGVTMWTLGEMAAMNEIAELSKEVFEDMEMEVKSAVVSPPPGSGNQFPEVCVWRCVFWKD